jgi:hypothetical protein
MEGGLDALFVRVKSMPPNRSSLGDAVYVDLLAFLLDANAFLVPVEISLRSASGLSSCSAILSAKTPMS